MWPKWYLRLSEALCIPKCLLGAHLLNPGTSPLQSWQLTLSKNGNQPSTWWFLCNMHVVIRPAQKSHSTSVRLLMHYLPAMLLSAETSSLVSELMVILIFVTSVTHLVILGKNFCIFRNSLYMRLCEEIVNTFYFHVPVNSGTHCQPPGHSFSDTPHMFRHPLGSFLPSNTLRCILGL